MIEERWGNCLTAAFRKRRLGVIRMVWLFDRALPHFAVIDWDRSEVHDAEQTRVHWWHWVHVLGEDYIRDPIPEMLWYPYRDVVRPLGVQRQRR